MRCAACLDLTSGTVTVRATQTEPRTSRRLFDARPKTDAVHRTVALPPHVLPLLSRHLDQYAGPDRVFVTSSGNLIHGDTLYQAFARARSKVGLDQLRFHDLRHTGQTLAAATGATLADLTKRLGHSSPAAAMRYLHTMNGRDEAIAEALRPGRARGRRAAPQASGRTMTHTGARREVAGFLPA